MCVCVCVRSTVDKYSNSYINYDNKDTKHTRPSIEQFAHISSLRDFPLARHVGDLPIGKRFKSHILDVKFC